jgi:hypothetical protein
MTLSLEKLALAKVHETFPNLQRTGFRRAVLKLESDILREQINFIPDGWSLEYVPGYSADTHSRNLWWGPATGVLRRIWAFLSAVDDIPVLRREARTSHGFTARAQYRRYLEHKILTLQVPQPVDIAPAGTKHHGDRKAAAAHGAWSLAKGLARATERVV